MNGQTPSYLHVNPNDVANLIELAYRNGEPYQWAREGLENALQADAKHVEFGVAVPLFEKTGRQIRTIADNGCGMDPDELQQFFTSFGGGGKPIGVAENFGQGIKSSTLSWNRLGVVVLSWTPDFADGSMIWIRWNTKSLRYELRRWEVGDTPEEREVSTCVVPGFDEQLGVDWSTLKPSFVEDHGTLVVLLGNEVAVDTVNGDPEKNEVTVRGIGRFLNNRFVSLPDDVDVTVVDVDAGGHSKTRSMRSPDGEIKYLHPRKVKGILGHVDPKAKKGKVVVDDHGAVIEWMLEPVDGSAASDRKSYGAEPMVCVTYGNEALIRQSRQAEYSAYGISVPEVARRVWLIVRPPRYQPGKPGWGVITDPSRHGLSSKGGDPLPIHDWQDQFFDKLPKPIAAALSSARATAGPSANADQLRQQLNRITPFIRELTAFAIGKGLSGKTNPQANGAAGVQRQPRPAEPRTRTHSGAGGTQGTTATLAHGGKTSGSQKMANPAVPAVIFTTDEDWPGEDRMIAHYDRHTNAAFLNIGHPIMEGLFKYYQNEYPKAGGGTAGIDGVVQAVYGELLAATIYHAKHLRAAAYGFTVNEIESLFLSDAALSTGLLGLINAEGMIRTRAGAKFGKSTSSIAKAGSK